MLIIHYLPKRQLGFVVSKELSKKFSASEIGSDLTIKPLSPKQEFSCVAKPITHFMVTTHVSNLRTLVKVLEDLYLEYTFVDGE